MKQLLFLLLFPCLALAQYQGNGNQKITLGEQTSADGLVYRGLASDTTRKPSVDTMAYILLDTNTNIIWQYKKAVNNAWTRVGGSISSGLTGLLPVANGGTNASTFTAGSVVFAGTSGTSLAEDNSNLFWNNSTKRLGIGVTPSYKLDILGSESMTSTITRAINIIDFDTYTSGSNKFQQTYSLNANQNVPTGTTNGGYIYGQSFSVSAGSTAPADSSNSGTLNNVTGIQMSFGITNAFNNPTVNSARGLSITPFAQSGNISELASLRLNNVSGTAGTITNNYAIYQESSVQKNYFAGNVGIGTTSPLSKLNILGTVRINSAAAPDANYYLQLENSASQKAKANSWDTYSDKRIKTDIQPILNAIDKVNLLNPVYYEKHDSYVENDFLNIDYDSSVKSLGFIAQEVYNIIPEAVNTGTTNELWAMDYTKIIPILTKAIQEQNALIKALEQRILILENK